MHVCVLGAGIVGLATAWQLLQDGHQVSVIDRGAPGHGASGSNGAQLSYAYVQPLADPAIWRQLPRLLGAPDSPLKLHPQLDPLQWRWALAFLAACNAARSRATTHALLALAARSRAAFEQMQAALQPACDYAAAGKLVLHASEASAAGARRQLALQRELGGPPQRWLSAEECIAVEPALAHYRARIAGAVHTPGECAADCLKLCGALAAALAARGVQFHIGREARGFVQRQGQAAALQTDAGELGADAFVMALGTASPRLARTLGVYLPIYPLKGYSITLEVDDTPGAAPRVSVTDSARKVVFARIGSRLRVAGMVELVGHDEAIEPARVRALLDATQALFPHSGAHLDDPQPWTGLRPATPTGLPIVGPLPGAPRNLLFNTGHGALGFTLAFGTAARIAQLLGPAPSSA